MNRVDIRRRSWQESPARRAAGGAAMAAYNIEQLNFLVVDDNRHIREIVYRLLTVLGARTIRSACDGEEALKVLREFPADIAICDWAMAPIDGIEFLRRLRQSDDSPNPFLPVIMLTGHTELHRVREARDAGMSEFLAKPLSAGGLYARISSIIERPRQFVRAGHFFGPDRRRVANQGYRGLERRGAEGKAA